MNILTFSTLYPNVVRPQLGIFVETRVRQLLASDEVTARVIAPVPWFPSRHPVFGRYAMFARVPAHDMRNGVFIQHPTYLLAPKIGMTVAPATLAWAAKSAIGRLLDEGFDIDVIDAQYFYPDGVAAVLLGRYFNKPVVITALGTDINVLPQYRLPRRMIQWAARHASGIVTVSAGLKAGLVGLGVDPVRVEVLRNGVDLAMFQPCDRVRVRQQLHMEGYTLLSVGNLIPLKGHHLAIAALSQLDGVKLVIAGEGPERGKLELLAHTCGVADRVSFIGSVPQTELRLYYGAADALVLASSREGWANVILESMACGTPVIGTDVGAAAEVIHTPAAGMLMTARSSDALVAAVRSLRATPADPHATRAHAARFDWSDTTAALLRLFRAAAGKPTSADAVANDAQLPSKFGEFS